MMMEEEPNEEDKIQLGIYDSFGSSIDYFCVIEAIFILTLLYFMVILFL